MFLLLNIPFLLIYIFVIKTTKDIFNPLTIPFFLFTVPSVIATFKLSVLQVDFSFSVLLIIWMTSFIFITLPALILALKVKKSKNLYENGINRKEERDLKIWHEDKYFKLLIFISLLYLTSFLYENYILYGKLFPISYSGEEFFGNQHAHVPVNGFINGMLRYIVPFIWLTKYHFNKKNRFLFLFFITTLIPISRMQRAAVVINLIIFILVLMKDKLPRLKAFLLLFVFLFSIGSLLSWIGYVRIGDRFYSSLIGMRSSNVFEDMFNIFYGYFCFSFDTFQRSIDYWISIGMPTFKGIGLVSGIYSLLQFDSLMPFLGNPYETIMSTRVYLNGATVLPTSIHQFVLDFGLIGCFLFEIVLMWIYLHLYLNANLNKAIFQLYIVFSYLLSYLSYYSPFMSLPHMALLLYGIILVVRHYLTKKDDNVNIIN